MMIMTIRIITLVGGSLPLGAMAATQAISPRTSMMMSTVVPA